VTRVFGKGRSRPIGARTCSECGATFHPLNRKAQVCGKRCAKRRERRLSRLAKQMATAKAKASLTAKPKTPEAMERRQP